jgi:hypothetical protein
MRIEFMISPDGCNAAYLMTREAILSAFRTAPLVTKHLIRRHTHPI